MTQRVLVLGAGPTGLAAAYRLAQRGVPVHVIERLPWVGGLCRTFQRGEFSLDLGPHRFTPHTQEVYDAVHDLCGEDLKVTPERVRFYMFHRFLAYPFRLSEVLRAVGPARSVKLIASWLADRSRFSGRKESDLNYEEWLRARFGRGVADLVFRPLVQKTWGVPLSELHWRLARQRIAVSSLRELMAQIITGKRGKLFQSPFYPPGTFLYPEKGYGTIPDRMAEAIVKAGGTVSTSSQVDKIFLRNGRAQGVLYRRNGAEEMAEGDFIISTLPVGLFAQMLSPEKTDGGLEAARAASARLRFRKLILVYLVVNRPQVYPYGVAFFPGSEFRFGRTWEQKNFSARMVPGGQTVFGAEVTCWETDPIWQAEDREVYETLIPQLERCNLIRRSEVAEYFTVRLGYVYPVWDVDFERNLAAVEAYVLRVENLIINGRPGLFFYNNLHHSLEMGFLAANHVLSGKPKAEQWERDALRFREYRLVE
ncbi:MAG: FAD-dependent oxidoreductase [Chloroflexi bacterium]|nr:FAD-dependent oxidoreductase [Chloroflexota bacterium]